MRWVLGLQVWELWTAQGEEGKVGRSTGDL